MNLHVTPEKIWMSIPRRATYAQAEKFARSSLTWIIDQQKRVSERKTDRWVTDGAIFSLWGEPVQIKVHLSETKNEICRDRNVLFLATRTGEPTDCQMVLEEWLEQELLRALANARPKWEAVVGEKPQSYYIRKMKTLWGSCSLRTRRICLNLKLVHEPPSWLDYIVVHELTHLLVANHSSDFWAKMDLFYPNWRVIRRQMRR